MANQQTKLLKLREEVPELKSLIKEKDRRFEDLERRIDDLEFYSHEDDLLISGLETRHRSYARATTRDSLGEDTPRGELNMLEQQVIQFLK